MCICLGHGHETTQSSGKDEEEEVEETPVAPKWRDYFHQGILSQHCNVEVIQSGRKDATEPKLVSYETLLLFNRKYLNVL